MKITDDEIAKPFEELCPSCNGSKKFLIGKNERSSLIECGECSGRGTILTPQGEAFLGFMDRYYNLRNRLRELI